MKLLMSMMMLSVLFTSSISNAQAQDSVSDAKVQKTVTSQVETDRPGGGWDLNNLRISVSHASKLLAPSKK